MTDDITPEQAAADWLVATVGERRKPGSWGRIVVEIVLENGEVAETKTADHTVRKFAGKSGAGAGKIVGQPLTQKNRRP